MLCASLLASASPDERTHLFHSSLSLFLLFEFLFLFPLNLNRWICQPLAILSAFLWKKNCAGKSPLSIYFSMKYLLNSYHNNDYKWFKSSEQAHCHNVFFSTHMAPNYIAAVVCLCEKGLCVHQFSNFPGYQTKQCEDCWSGSSTWDKLIFVSFKWLKWPKLHPE